MNPYFSLPLTFLVGLLLIWGMVWLSWRETSPIEPLQRLFITALRLAGLFLVFLLFLNPGSWVQPISKQETGWQVLLDQSASMAVPDAADGQSRWDHALSLLESFQKKAKQKDFPVELRPFSDELLPATSEPTTLKPEKEGSDLSLATRTLLNTGSASGIPTAGLLILSDGRQTTDAALDPSIISAARAGGIPIHTYPLGGQVSPPDVQLTTEKRLFTSFSGQQLNIPAKLHTTGMGALRLHLTLKDSEGTILAEEKIDHPGEKEVTVNLKLPSPEKTTQWTLNVAPIEGETRGNNNEVKLFLRILDSKTKVLLIEGAPYWDSKFLAQMLRRQEYIQIRAIYRLSDDRYFQVSSEKHDPIQSSETNFPETQEELSQYDLVVLGKNVEPFLTPNRLNLLKSYVRDQGGALLFSRGKAYAGDFPELEALEPSSWSTGKTQNFRLIPSSDGESAGLFGQALPGKESPIWKQLPALQDAHQPHLLKPFSRVLAEGEITGTSNRFPLLMIRRYGQGVTGVMNADGLWKWDFFPEAREQGNMYLDFWSQLLQWMASYSEFLPGQDYSLKTSESTLKPGNNVEIRLAYRGSEAASPTILITPPESEPITLTPARLPNTSRPEWRATYKMKTPGTYALTVEDAAVETPMPVNILSVLPPPAEKDELSADATLLAELSAETGGLLLNEKNWKSFLSELKEATAVKQSLAPPVWEPVLHHWFYGLLIALIFSLEWWLRRRQGLS